MTRFRSAAMLLLAALLGTHAAAAQAQVSTCVAIADDRERLACYDSLAGREAPPALLTAPSVASPSVASPSVASPSVASPSVASPSVASPSVASPSVASPSVASPSVASPSVASPSVTSPSVASPSAAPAPDRTRSPSTFDAGTLESLWELRPELKQGTFRLTPYAPLYALLRVINSPNDQPSSPTRSLSPPSDVHLDHVEAKLQLSLKTKLVENILGGNADLWFGYTQQSYWQIANSRFSSPFRETDYLPEAILIQPLNFGVGNVNARFVGMSLAHQSNGRGESLSRSWNRLIGNVAIESGPWSLQVRPWLRIDTASGTHDDNPDIEDFVGRGEMVAVYRNSGHVLTFTARHSLRGGDRSHGAGEIDWAFPLTGSMRGHVQVFTGFGENLIDYNHRQTTFGLGVSFFD